MDNLEAEERPTRINGGRATRIIYTMPGHDQFTSTVFDAQLNELAAQVAVNDPDRDYRFHAVLMARGGRTFSIQHGLSLAEARTASVHDTAGTYDELRWGVVFKLMAM